MASTAQTLANRENALRSTGPRSTTGKLKSSANSVSHGLSSTHRTLANEDADQYASVLNGFISEFAPNGYHETFLVELMVNARWRIARTERLECVYFANAQLAHSKDNPDEAILSHMASKGVDVLNALGRYAAAAQATYFKAHRELIAGRRSSADCDTAQARRATAEARREIAETDRAISEFCAPLPAALRMHQAVSGSSVEFTERSQSSVDDSQDLGVRTTQAVEHGL